MINCDNLHLINHCRNVHNSQGRPLPDQTEDIPLAEGSEIHVIDDDLEFSADEAILAKRR